MRTGLIFVDFRLHCSLVGDREGGCHTEQGNLDSVFPSPLDLLLTVAVVQTVACERLARFTRDYHTRGRLSVQVTVVCWIALAREISQARLRSTSSLIEL